ncbi:MAG TPA: LysR family transcriptional regulator [Noviherbaspirillum sp.]|nr:LysR family transcriptional regulator [Noviherbaspirillum sp.]
MSKLDPTSLRLFVRIVEEGSIAAVASREHIAASAISRRISELEYALKTQLLARTNKGVEATAAGITLANLARGVLHEMDEIHAQMLEYASGVRGHVRVMANISAIIQFLPNEILAFRRDHPHVQVHLQESISAAITKAVYENAADIGIYTVMPHGQDLETFPYHVDELVLIAPEGHPLASRRTVSFRDTLDHEYVGLHTGSAINMQLLRAAAEMDMTIRMAMQVTSYDALCVMVEAGLGIGILPREVARRFAKGVGIRVIKLDEPWARRQLKICVRSFNALPGAAQLLVNHLKQGGNA